MSCPSVASEIELVASYILFFGGGQGTLPSKTSKFFVFFRGNSIVLILNMSQLCHIVICDM